MARLGLAIHEFVCNRLGVLQRGDGSADSWMPKPSFGMTAEGRRERCDDSD
jgi:hypothetical protein